MATDYEKIIEKQKAAEALKALTAQAEAQFKSSGAGTKPEEQLQYFWDYNRQYYDALGLGGQDIKKTIANMVASGSAPNVFTEAGRSKIMENKYNALLGEATDMGKSIDAKLRDNQILAASNTLGRGSLNRTSLAMFTDSKTKNQTTDIFKDKGILQPTIPQNSLDLLG
jgi:hypothetical protein